MADRVERKEQAMVVATDNEKDLFECIRQTFFMIREFFKLRFFMFSTCICNEAFRGPWDEYDRHIGSLYYYDIENNHRFGTFEVCEIQTGDGKVILPGTLHGDDTFETVSASHLPIDFRSFPNRTDYIDIHRFESDFHAVFQQEYRDTGGNKDEDAAPSNDTDPPPENTGGRPNSGYRRMKMEEITDVIQSRHDPCTPSMKNIEQRTRTFHGWRMNGNWATDQMAQAGFFYTGIGNQAECYHCGFRVYEWDESPLVTHVRWAPRCGFLREAFSLDVIHGILFNRKQN